ncbi:basement membrane-specific heparan sulfate proteoglycan core protein-like [Dermacentor variabilis]|uniref:basement membrane-specific heparan sulfate proteoglycan core protein-like n=1 Tax=Dermacentor variabilis TaxID=34621 RepID=UPI003F5B66E7
MLRHPSRTLYALLFWTLLVTCHGTPVHYKDQDDDPVPEQDETEAPSHVGQEGGQVELPCTALHSRHAATPASPVRVEWHRRGDADPEPVYAVHFPGRANLMQGRHQPRKDWSPRAYFAVLGSPAALKVKALGLADAGVYTCQVTRSDGSVQASIVRLSVLGPLEPPVIRDESGNIVNETAGPYMEGDVATLACQVKAAGSPAPEVRWLRRPRRPSSDEDEEPVPRSAVTTVSSALDDAQESVLVLSKLRQGPLTRADLLIQLVCEVDNGLAAPVRTTVRIDMLLAPLTVRILRASGGALTAGLPVELVCEARGSRPPAQLTWWKRGVQLAQSFGHASADGNVSTSVVSFTPSAQDHGQGLRCVARNPALPPSAPAPHDKWAMNVYYKPNVTLRLGQPFRDLEIQEGGDVYLECHVNANPPSSEVHWSKDGVEDFATKTLNGSTLPDVIISGRFLALQKARRSFSGRYACSATNSEGASTSNSLRLKVLHAPTCVEGAPIVYSASRHEPVRVTCRVAASPKAVRFRWSFSSSTRRTELTDFVVLGPESDPEGTPVLDGDSPTVVSVLEYTPQFQSDFGTLLCSASNSMGDQREPCTFHVVQAGPPEPLENCSVTNLTERSFSVECREVRSPSSAPAPGGGGQSPGTAGGASLVAAAQRPSLLARPPENLVYVLEVYGPPEGSSMQRGVSASQHQVLVRNVSGPEPRFRVGQLWPGTEFEARVFAANSKGRSRPFRLNACTLPPAEALLDKVPTWTLGFSILHWLLLVLFLVLITVAIVLLIWFRRRMQHNTTEGTNKTTTEVQEPWCGQMAQTVPVSRSRSSVISTKDEIMVLDKRKDTVDV